MHSLLIPFLDSHIKSYDIKNDYPSAFEHLTNYLAVRNYTSRHFDPIEIGLGKGEVGIDGVAVIINDTLITTFDKEFFENANDISASFIFTQSKTSESFELNELSHFFTAVNDFLGNGKIEMNERATEIQKICHYILENPMKLTKNPDCHLYFSFTGNENDNQKRDAVVSNQIEFLKQKSMYDDITFSLYDVNKIVSICRSMKNSIKKSIQMSDAAVLPPIQNITESYIGVVNCADYINLITNDDGAIISNLFEDNVRYFQGQNTINAEMQSTLRDENERQKFSVLNNGVTIVAKEIRRTGNNFTLSDFQIVNGCQTSFVLYENRRKLIDDKNAFLIVKLISTKDKEITDSIVKATNRQTPVLNEAFETLRDFHKNLEDIYSKYPPEYRLFYERRSKQYDSGDINKSMIVSFPFQTSAYIAVFLEEPHSVHRYYGELLKSYKKRLYNDDDILEQYCMASMYVYVVDKFLKHNSIYDKFKKYRFHIALMLRCLAVEEHMPYPNSRKMKEYCEELYKKISDTIWVRNSVYKSCDIINKIINETNLKPKDGNDISRTREFTNLIIERLGKSRAEDNIIQDLPELKTGCQVKCKVKSWNNSFAYVDLPQYKEVGSIHIRYISGNYISDIGDVLKCGQELTAIIINDEPHPVFGYNLSLIQL